MQFCIKYCNKIVLICVCLKQLVGHSSIIFNFSQLFIYFLTIRFYFQLDDLMRSKRIRMERNTVSSPMYPGAMEDSQPSDSNSDGDVTLEILDDDLSCVVCQWVQY